MGWAVEARGDDGNERALEDAVVSYCAGQVQHLPGLHERYWARLDEARRDAVRLRTERRMREATGVRELRN